MPVPADAEEFTVDYDPQENIEFIADCSTLLESGEQIDTFTLVALAEALALGLDFRTGTGITMGKVPISGTADRGVRFRPVIDAEFEDDAAFDDPGTRQRTFLLRVRQQ